MGWMGKWLGGWTDTEDGTYNLYFLVAKMLMLFSVDPMSDSLFGTLNLTLLTRGYGMIEWSVAGPQPAADFDDDGATGSSSKWHEFTGGNSRLPYQQPAALCPPYPGAREAKLKHHVFRRLSLLGSSLGYSTNAWHCFSRPPSTTAL